MQARKGKEENGGSSTELLGIRWKKKAISNAIDNHSGRYKS